MPPETHDDIERDTEPQPLDAHRLRRRLAAILGVVLVFLLLAFIPPLLNVNRFQRRVDRNISAALGRPVHFDKLSLTLLPMPGFTLENFVVDEDPAFGAEPILRSDQVSITLRLSSLWRRQVEFSKISFAESTSVNLVHRSDGRWNIEGLLFQASHIQAAPTAQRFAGATPRFPYIEATGTRLNLKLDQEKTPFSLTDAEFALWQPEEHQWRLRLLAHPTRTDMSPGDPGILRVEGTLGGPGTPAALDQTPIDLRGRWQDAQLGDLSRLISGNDAGLRGAFSLTFGILGTVDHNTITTDVTFDNVRRADFVPPSPLSLEAGCRAEASNTFRTFAAIECHWPPAESSNRSTLIVTADLPDVRQPERSSGRITLPAVPADTFFNWLSVATPHPPNGLTGPGTLAGTLAWSPQPAGSPLKRASWSGELEFSGGSVTLNSANQKRIPLIDVILRSTPLPAPPSRHSSRAATPPPAPDGFDLEPVSLSLGGKEPATLTGHLDDTGYTLHLAGSAVPARLVDLGNAIPQLGDGLQACLQQLALVPPPSAVEPPAPNQTLAPDHDQPPAASPAPPPTRGGLRGTTIVALAEQNPALLEDLPAHIDLTATRTWGGPQTWCTPTPTQPTARTRPSR